MSCSNVLINVGFFLWNTGLWRQISNMARDMFTPTFQWEPHTSLISEGCNRPVPAPPGSREKNWCTASAPPTFSYKNASISGPDIYPNTDMDGVNPCIPIPTYPPAQPPAFPFPQSGGHPVDAAGESCHSFQPPPVHQHQLSPDEVMDRLKNKAREQITQLGRFFGRS
eukprot:Protomagalhaensia_sp_Gyna_25__2304@NODE_2263_length_1185_cov_133_103839_g1876_i0_p1_GENE_NODE_2263_length_1185_cov_133_103839_g1876_i0NODE_2263_length_1185_cov_133_103839_g1876_i0_p1_ORF_typecomplete_len168_score11_13_NODE_2263_length_1185_cov_133_103839_g1876_i0161664